MIATIATLLATVRAVVGPARAPESPAPPSARTPLLVRGLQLLAVAAALAGAVLPVVNARWQLLDDGLIVDGSMARFDSVGNRSFRAMGRNFYFVGLYFEAQRQAFGTWIAGFFAVQGAIVLATCLLVYRTVRRFPGTAVTAPLAVILFALASPVPEVTHTLYKFEVRLTFFWLAASLLGIRFLESLAAGFPGRRRWGSLAWTAPVVYAGYLVGKEPIAALPLVAGMIGVIGLVAARRGQRRYAAGLLGFAALAAAGVAAAMATNRALGVQSVSGGSYTSGNFKLLTDQIAVRLVTFHASIPDVLLLTVVVTLLAVVALAVVVVRRGFDPWAAAAGVAAASCASALAFNLLLWEYMQVYYHYPVSAYGAVALGLLLPMLAWPRRAAVRWAAVGFGTLLITTLLAAGAPLNVYRTIAYERALKVDADMLAQVAKLPPNTRVALHLPEGHETIHNAGVVLAFVHNRPDIAFESALSEQYLARPKESGEVILWKSFGEANWLLTGREMYGVRPRDEKDVRLMVEIDPSRWEVVSLVSGKPVAFYHHWRVHRGEVRTRYQHYYAWTLVRRK